MHFTSYVNRIVYTCYNRYRCRYNPISVGSRSMHLLCRWTAINPFINASHEVADKTEFIATFLCPSAFSPVLRTYISIKLIKQCTIGAPGVVRTTFCWYRKCFLWNNRHDDGSEFLPAVHTKHLHFLWPAQTLLNASAASASISACRSASAGA